MKLRKKVNVMNNCYEFNSVLKDELYNFINFKRSLGLKYDKRRTRDYKLIDDYWIEHNITDIKIMKVQTLIYIELGL